MIPRSSGPHAWQLSTTVAVAVFPLAEIVTCCRGTILIIMIEELHKLFYLAAVLSPGISDCSQSDNKIIIRVGTAAVSQANFEICCLRENVNENSCERHRSDHTWPLRRFWSWCASGTGLPRTEIAEVTKVTKAK
jgi:hypothetical protein